MCANNMKILNIEAVAKNMALAMLELNLKDYKGNPEVVKSLEDASRKNLDWDKDTKIFNLKKRYCEALKWFEDKSQETFGYYWCLEHAEFNPNRINEYLKEHRKIEWE